MAKRVAYVYRDDNIWVVPIVRVLEMKRAAEKVFEEYRNYKCNRPRVLGAKIEALARTLYIWTRRRSTP